MKTRARWPLSAEMEKNKGDTEKLHREAPDGAPDLQPSVEREEG